MEAENASSQLREINAELDTLADSRDLPPHLVSKLRSIQRDVQNATREAKNVRDDADSQLH